MFRLWYVDHALHCDFSKQEDPTHTVSYLGMLQQSLLDLSACVEKRVKPIEASNYKVIEGQVIVPSTARTKGIQAVIDVKANGGNRADIAVGQSVTFTSVVSVPLNSGKIIAAQ